MAFSSFGNTGNAMGGGAAAGGLTSGPDLETIQTEALGFLSIAGDAKLRLTSSWAPLPTATSSLLSIAPRKGLVAAAGPDQVILATTESVRKGFESPKDGDSDIRAFEPQLKMPMPMRVSQLAFTADENYLVLSAETGGGLAVYEVQSLLQGSTNSAFELSTNGEPLRALIPNPTSEKAELCAIVTNGGNLHMANLKDRSISNPLKDRVSCVSWSSKGKQLCAGLGDGTIYQMTPEGTGKGDIPKPPNLGNCHVSSLTWLENNLFLAIHTSTNESPPASIYHIITRQPPSSFNFQKLTDPVDPFGSDKIPHHTMLRLRDFAPALQDLLIVSSTASTEVGLLSRSKTALATDKPADSITGVFTTTELLDDTKRPTLPMTDSMEDSTPVGFSLDLSSKDKVYKPIPSDDEIEDSPGPLPGLWVLTHEGVLCSWWLVYTDSIRQGTTYSGLAAVEEAPAVTTPAQAAPAAALSPFSKPAAPTFGSTSSPFGGTSQLGQKVSPWGAAASSTTSTTGGAIFGSSSFGSALAPQSPAAPSTTPMKAGGATFGASSFGSAPAAQAPAFGKPSAIGFGQSSQLGSKASPWATAGASTGASTASSGQSGFASFANKNDGQSAFGSAAPSSNAAATPSAFSGFAKQGGFASLGGNTSGGSIFGSGSKPSSNPFGSSTPTDTAFPPKQDNKPSPFGSTPFKLGSTFKPDPAVAEDSNQPAAASGSSLFGSGFGSVLNATQEQSTAKTPPVKDEEMDVMESTEQTPQAKPQSSLFPTTSSQESTTPTTTPAPPRFGSVTSPAPGTSIFGPPTTLGSSGGLFGSKADTSKSSSFFGSKQTTPPRAEDKSSEPETPRVKVQESPLPPDATSRTAYPLGDSSSSSAASNAPAMTTPLKQEETSDSTTPRTIPEEAPLPPDFTKVSKQPEKQKTPDAPLPPDFVKPPRPVVPEAPLPPDPSPSEPKIKVEEDAPLPPDFIAPKAPSREPSAVPPMPSSDSESGEVDDDEDEDESESGEENASEGSGVDVARDLSPSTSGLTSTPGFTPQHSFSMIGKSKPATAQKEKEQKPVEQRPLFGEISRNAPTFARPNPPSPRSPSPIRGAVPNRILRSDASRSVSTPNLNSSMLRARKSQSQLGGSIVGRERQSTTEDPFLQQHRRQRAQQEAEETQPLVDEEDDDLQKILASDVEGTLELDEFIAHSNVAPPARESVPSQVEAVYRDINSMIDTLGLNSRALKAFVKGHGENGKEGGRQQNDLDIAEDWVLCEIDELGNVLQNELYPDLEDSRVRDLEEKRDACHDMARDMHRLRAKQEDLRRVIMARMDPSQAEAARSLPLSAEQASQQNELRREYTNFTKLLSETEEALTLLKTRIASVNSASGKGGSNVPTVEAVIRTITKMTTMVEKRSGDVDVLENQLRKVRLESASREGSPMVTPQARRSIMFSPETTPSRGFRHSVSSMGAFGSPARATPPRKKLSGFSREEKGDLMDKRARRLAVLGKLKDSVEKRGVTVWNLEDIE